MKITRKQLKKLIGEAISRGQSYNTTFPFGEIADYFQNLGYNKVKANAGEERGAALFQMPITSSNPGDNLGYYVDVRYEYGTFYFLWLLRTKRPDGRIHVLKPGGGAPRWEVEYRQSDLKVVMDEINYEISIHASEGVHPFDLGLPASRFSFKG